MKPKLDVYPMLGIGTPGAEVYTNYGQRPFLFNLPVYSQFIAPGEKTPQQKEEIISAMGSGRMFCRGKKLTTSTTASHMPFNATHPSSSSNRPQSTSERQKRQNLYGEEHQRSVEPSPTTKRTRSSQPDEQHRDLENFPSTSQAAETSVSTALPSAHGSITSTLPEDLQQTKRLKATRRREVVKLLLEGRFSSALRTANEHFPTLLSDPNNAELMF